MAGLKRPMKMLGALTLTLATACGTGELEDHAPDVTTTQAALAGASTLWNGFNGSNPSALGTGATVPVCFVIRKRITLNGQVTCPGTSAFEDCEGVSLKADPTATGFNPPVLTFDRNVLRPFIKDRVMRTWAREANLSFVGWDDCPIDPGSGFHLDSQMGGTIAVQFGSKDDVSGSFGYHPDKPTVLQFDWKWLIKAAEGATTGIKMATVSSFGFALGFVLEVQHPDAQCGGGALAIKNGFRFTPWPDADSIMGACGLTPDTDTLSSGDIIGVRTAYGRRPLGTLVGTNGLCTNVGGGVSTIGQPIIGYPCNGAPNDRWYHSTSPDRWLATLSDGAQRCLNVSGGVVSSAAPTPVGSWVCNTDDNEKFPLDSVEWRGMGGMCVDAGAISGSVITLKDCNGTGNQKWSFMDSNPSTTQRYDQIRLAGNNLCVSTQTFSGAIGELLVMRTCDPTDSRQRFVYSGRGVISHGSFCANVGGGTLTPGATLGLWDGCSLNPAPINEQFELSGNIKTAPLPVVGGSPTRQCLDGANPNQVSVSTCQSSNQNQIWEYFL